LDISDNNIGFEGSRFLSLALQENNTLQKLNIKMNNIGDQGGAALFKDLQQNESLIELNVAANGLAEKVTPLYIQLISRLSRDFANIFQVSDDLNIFNR